MMRPPRWTSTKTCRLRADPPAVEIKRLRPVQVGSMHWCARIPQPLLNFRSRMSKSVFRIHPDSRATWLRCQLFWPCAGHASIALDLQQVNLRAMRPSHSLLNCLSASSSSRQTPNLRSGNRGPGNGCSAVARPQSAAAVRSKTHVGDRSTRHACLRCDRASAPPRAATTGRFSHDATVGGVRAIPR